MASSNVSQDLAPSEIWDLVKVLNDKLAATREELREMQEENKQLRGGLETLREAQQYTEGPKCNKKTCPFAIKAKELRGTLKTLKSEHAAALVQQNEEVADLKCQITALEMKTMEAETMRRALEALGHSHMKEKARTQERSPATPNELPTNTTSKSAPATSKAAALNTSAAVGETANPLPDWSSLKPCIRTGHRDPTSQIPSHILIESQCQNPLFCSKDILWDSGSPGKAYLIHPDSLYDPFAKGRRWTRNTYPDSLIGQQREIFYVEIDPNVYYAGTYNLTECYELPESDYDFIPTVLLEKIQARSLLKADELSAQERSRAHVAIQAAYNQGEASLVRRHHEKDNVKNRVSSSSYINANKRRNSDTKSSQKKPRMSGVKREDV